MITPLLALGLVSGPIPDSIARLDLTVCRDNKSAYISTDGYSARWHTAEHSVRLIGRVLADDKAFLLKNVATNVKTLTYGKDGNPQPEASGTEAFVKEIKSAAPATYTFVSGRSDFSAVNLCGEVEALVTLMRADGVKGFDCYMTYTGGVLGRVEILPLNSRTGTFSEADNG